MAPDKSAAVPDLVRSGTATEKNNSDALLRVAVDSILGEEPKRPEPFGSAARALLAAGWSPIPLPVGAKFPPPAGFTGEAGADVTADQLDTWLSDGWSGGNVAVRVPDHVIGLDVDAYDGHGGEQTLVALEGRLGPLPAAPRLTSRAGADWASGIRFYRVPAGRRWVSGLPGIEIVQYAHRYAVTAPSLHPSGRVYRWVDDPVTGGSGLPDGQVPAVDELPELPAAWVADLCLGPRGDRRLASPEQVVALTAAMPDGDLCQAVQRRLDQLTDALEDAAGGLHDQMTRHVMALVRLGEQGHHGVPDALDEAQRQFLAALSGGRDPSRARGALAEFDRALTGAVRKIAAEPTDEENRRCCGTDLDAIEWDDEDDEDDLGGFTIDLSTGEVLADNRDPAGELDADEAGTGSDDDAEDDDAEDRRTVTLRKFPRLDLSALVDPARPPRRWLLDDLVPYGEQVTVVAPAGVGKSLWALALAVRCSRDAHEFVGRHLDFPREGRVLLIDMENSDDDLSERLRDLGVNQSNVAQVMERLTLLSMPPLHGLDTLKGARDLVAILDAYQIGAGDLLILDSTQRVTEGEENSNDTMRAFYRYTGAELKRRGITTIRTDNTPWAGDRERGGSSKRDDVGYVLLLKPDEKKPNVFSLTPLKHRGKRRLDTDSDGSLTFERVQEPGGVLEFRPAKGTTFGDKMRDIRAELARLGVPETAGQGAAWDAMRQAKEDALAAHDEALAERLKPMTKALVQQVQKERKEAAELLGMGDDGWLPDVDE